MTVFGVAVSDGQNGVAARLAPGATALDLVLHFNAAAETGLFAEATDSGLLTVARWAGRDARVGRVLPGFPPIPDLPDGYSSRAHVVGTEHFVIYNDDKVTIYRLEDGEPLASVAVDGFIQSSAAGPGCAVFATSDFINVVRWDGAALTNERVVITERTRVSARFAEALPREKTRGKRISGRSEDGVWTYAIGKIDARDSAAVEAARATLVELGGTDVAVGPDED